MPGYTVIGAELKIALALGALTLAAAGLWKVYHSGTVAERREQEAKAAELVLKQTQDLTNFNENQRHLERALSAKVAKAQNDRFTKTVAAKPVADALAAELGGLSRDVYALNSDASGQPAAACKIAAVTARNVFEQCVKRYTEVAGAADGHDADAVTFEQAWPK